MTATKEHIKVPAWLSYMCASRIWEREIISVEYCTREEKNKDRVIEVCESVISSILWFQLWCWLFMFSSALIPDRLV